MITPDSIGLNERLGAKEIAVTDDESPVLYADPAAVTPVTLGTIVEDHKMNGALLAFRLMDILGYYAEYPTVSDLILTVTWIMSTWLRNPEGGLAFKVHPRWFAIGEKGSGKSRMMEEVDALAYRSSGPMSNVTSAFVRDAIADNETVLLEEAQRLFQRGGGKIEIQSATTAHKETARSGDGRGGLNNRSLYGPMGLVARPSIIYATGGMEDGALADLFSRALPLIRTVPASRIIPDQDESWDFLMSRFRAMLAAWGAQNSPRASEDDPRPRLWPIHKDATGNALPGITSGRQREIAMAHLAVADRLVSPRMILEKGQDTRWAEMTRKAIRDAFRGKSEHGSDLIAEIEAHFRKMNVTFQEEER